MKLRFWLAVFDVTSWLHHTSWRLHLWVTGRLGAATDWGEGADCSGGSGEEPF